MDMVEDYIEAVMRDIHAPQGERRRIDRKSVV